MNPCRVVRPAVVVVMVLAVAALLGGGCGDAQVDAGSGPGAGPGAVAVTADWVPDSFEVGGSETLTLRHPTAWKRQDQEPFGHYSWTTGVLSSFATHPGCDSTPTQLTCGESLLGPLGPGDVLVVVGTAGGMPGASFDQVSGSTTSIIGRTAKVSTYERATVGSTVGTAVGTAADGPSHQSADYCITWSIASAAPSPWTTVTGCTRGPDDEVARQMLSTMVMTAAFG
jgi:hypothetical protein